MSHTPTYQDLLNITAGSETKSLTSSQLLATHNWCDSQSRADIYRAFFNSQTPKRVRVILLDCVWIRTTGGAGDPPTPDAYLRRVH